MSTYEIHCEEIRDLTRAITILETLRDAKQAELDAMPTEEMVITQF
jgi:hypothetical protein